MINKTLNKINEYVINRSKLLNKLMKDSRGFVVKFFKYTFLVGFSFVILYPILKMVSRSFMGRMDVYDNSVALFPKNFTHLNFELAVKCLNYFQTLSNTVGISVIITILQTIICLLAGYGFARYHFRFKKILYGVILLSIIVPPQLLSLFQYLDFRFFNEFGVIKLFFGQPFNLINTYWPFIILAITGMGIKNGIFIFLFMQFFRNMPTALEEAAYIDGASDFKIFRRIMLPNAITMIVTVCLFSLVWQYNDTQYSKLFLVDKTLFGIKYYDLILTNEIVSLLGVNISELSVEKYLPLIRSAAILIIVAPLIIFYLFAKKYFVESVERSGMVG